MAGNRPKVLLGFEDELINDKYKNQTNFTTNKIGGIPDTPPNITLELTKCPFCQLPRPLVVQIYAPLENSTYHRTLYLFACINPNCRNQVESWICIRVQSQENIIESELGCSPKENVTGWCVSANDWDDDNNVNINEENGNLINEKVSDEDEESCSLDESFRIGLGNLTMDDCNANNGALSGAVGRLHSPSATAEIEGDEGEVISIDTPTVPQRNIAALMQEVAPLPSDFYKSINSEQKKADIFQFMSSFISVWEESTNIAISDGHVKELLQEYQQRNEDVILSPDCGGASAQLTESAFEKYEKSHPTHGDKVFHHFITKIQMNPGQILRYSRDTEPPLLVYPMQEIPKKCLHCQEELVFEFQLLPTIIPKLKLNSDVSSCSRLEFGTILVFTCRKSCWSTGTNLRYETAVLQTEVY